MRPVITMISPSEIEAIHECTLRVLEKTGVVIESPEVVEALRSAGAQCTGNAVRFPRQMVEEAIAQINKEVLFAATNPANDLILPKRALTYNSTGGYSPFIYDEPGKGRRRSTADDTARIARLCDKLDEVDFFWPICMPTEENLAELQETMALNIALRNIGKHVECSCASRGAAEWQIRIAQAVAGGADALKKRPIFSAVASPTTPLAFEHHTSEAMMLLAKAGVPVTPMNVPMAGTTAPSTFAGALVITNAEQLATLVILKTFNPNAPMVYSADTGSADMRTGDVAYANPDYDLFSVACGDLARFYEIPCCVAHGSSEIREFDTLPGFDRNVLRTAISQLTRTDTSCWMGSKDNCLSSSLWDIVMDAEVVRYAKLFCKGPAVDEERLAFDVIDEVGPRGEYISHEHTLDHFRDEICLETLDKSFLFHGPGDSVENAHARAEELLAGDRAPILAPDCERELDEIMAAARAAFA